MRIRVRLVAAACVLLLALQLVACAASDALSGYRPVDTRTQAAEAVASGVIAAAAGQISSDLEYYLPGDEFAGLRSTLADAVPDSLSADPLRYEVEFSSDPQTVDRLTAIVTSMDGPDRFRVELEWDDAGSRSVWRDGVYEEVAGDWAVKSAEMLAE
ncbi:MAG: hypothetical protein ACYC2X_10675 [Coriobacteriia bacterium]